MKSNKKISVIYGGFSAEREVSLNTGKNIFEALKANFNNVELIDAGVDLADKLYKSKPDVCFNALHGTFGEDGCVQGLLEMMGIPYTGSGVAASAVAFDKALSKAAFVEAKLKTPKYVVTESVITKAPFMPCVVKPARQGSSVGITIVKNEKDFKSAVAEAFKYDTKIIIEEFIEGKEITVPIMGDESYPPIWIRPKKQFYDYECKYTKGMTEYLFETGLSKSRLATISKIAKAAYKVCMCRSIARADFILTDKACYLIEMNTLPGMTSTSLVPKSAAKKGISFEELIKRITESASLDNNIKVSEARK